MTIPGLAIKNCGEVAMRVAPEMLAKLELLRAWRGRAVLLAIPLTPAGVHQQTAGDSDP